jgi:hypothetical protein
MLSQKQIAAMTDDEADVFIASKIFGMTWKSWSWNKDDETVKPYSDDHGCWERDDRAAGGVFESEWVNVPDSHSWTPARCIDDAMKAVKKIGLRLRVGKRPVHTGRFSLIYHEELDLWVAGWFHEESVQDDAWNEVDWEGTAQHPARAVCNAVIAAHEASHTRG